MTAVATGHEASFAGAGEAVLEVLADLGLDTSGARLADASGLSSASRLTPQLLTEALRLVADGSHPELLTVADGVPVAGDRKSTRLNSSHVAISYAVFCLKKNRYGTLNPA